MKSYYNYLIKKSRNTLLKLISIRGEGADIQAKRILKPCSMEVVETVNIIMILGRDYYDEEVELAVQSLMAAMEPLIIVILAGVVGVLVMSVILPMLSMYDTLNAM